MPGFPSMNQVVPLAKVSMIETNVGITNDMATELQG